ncbi:hypothetical protein [Paraflavitalea speifideaquila]|uniref:hypothetical protein n=1 Tax=Paraflavitalea speifideaquila TaxID=3076558 RepID=UPI0028F0FC96|nr:hypothetical protein [Paraflavitalea speifideiaquila]
MRTEHGANKVLSKASQLRHFSQVLGSGQPSHVIFLNFSIGLSAMKKRLQHIDLPPHLEEFRKNYLAATEVEATLCGIITCYKMYGAYFIRTKSSLTGKRVKKDKRFARTRHNASVLAMASEWVTPYTIALRKIGAATTCTANW